MQLWRHKDKTADTGAGGQHASERAEMILARKPPRPAGGRALHPGLLDVIVPRYQPRQNHERNEDRRVLSGVEARIAWDDAAFPAGIANLSSNGMMIASDRIIPIGSEVAAEIDGCAAIPMVVRWVGKGRIGLEFVAETTIIAQAGVQQYIIDTIRAESAASSFGAESGAEIGAGPEKRYSGLRHSLMWLCGIAAGAQEGAARIRNLSRSGAMISFDGEVDLAPGQGVELVMGDASRFPAEVRWAVDGLAGLSFPEPFPVEMLIEQPCAHIVDDDDAHSPRAYASREEAMRIEYTGMTRPYDAPDMDYQPLTLSELYATLYTPVNPVEP